MKKLVFIDLDGTLLHDDKQISAYSLNTIRKLRESGAIVCIASGRPGIMVRYYLHLLQLDTPLITNNAANISIASTGEILMQKCLPVPEAARFLDYCKQHDLDWAIFFHDSIVTTGTPIRLARYGECQAQLASVGLEPFPVKTAAPDDDLAAILEKGAERLSILVDADREKELIAAYFASNTELNCIRSTPDSFDIVHPDVDKWVGVQFIADYYHIPVSEVYIFGNDRNDLKMIQNCPHSFVVENGEAEVLKHAAHIIESNNEDGVAKAIEQYLL